MRIIAECELKRCSMYFSKDRTPFISGPKKLVTDDYVNSDERLKKIVNLHFTKNIISEVKRESFYPDVLDTVRQYLEYCADVEKDSNSILWKGFFY